MSHESGQERLRFARFVFDRSTRELYVDGTRVPLQEQPSQILNALLHRPGEIVTREDLRERIWNADTFVDFDHGLNTAVKKIRRALGDSAEVPSFIETLPRRGYRFIAPVELAGPTAQDATSVTAEATHTPAALPSSRGLPRPTLWIAALVAVALLAGLAWQVGSRPQTTTTDLGARV